MGATDTGLWPFSLDLYFRPGMAEACLKLQDGWNADVNILLLCFWRARLGFGDWAPDEITRAEAAVAPINTVLTPFRQARRALKALQEHEPAVPALYDEAMALELKLEEVAQAWLAAVTRVTPAMRVPGQDERLAAATHLSGYLDHIARGDQAALQLGARLLDAAFTA